MWNYCKAAWSTLCTVCMTCPLKEYTLSAFLSSVNGACHALSDGFVEENFSDQLFLHHLGSEDDRQSKSNVVSDMLTVIFIPKTENK